MFYWHSPAQHLRQSAYTKIERFSHCFPCFQNAIYDRTVVLFFYGALYGVSYGTVLGYPLDRLVFNAEYRLGITEHFALFQTEIELYAFPRKFL